MNIKKLFSQHLGLVVAILAAAAPAVTAGAAELDRSPARVTQAAAGKPLTAASRATPETMLPDTCAAMAALQRCCRRCTLRTSQSAQTA